MTARAYAKINLGLRILRKRSDGYHDLETVFHQIDQYDELEFRLHEHAVILTSNHPSVPTDDSNLCVQAANLLRDLTGTSDGVEIALRKNIPLGAGLGGGSSDAALTLKSLVGLWNLDISPQELHTLALSLGSDVPFFLEGGSAYATGRGELLAPLSLSLPYWILVVTPPVHVSTAWAYKTLARKTPLPLKEFNITLLNHLHHPEILSMELTNDFEPIVLEAHPELRRIRETLLNGGMEMVFLSGSGSSIFGMTKSEATAKQQMKKFSSTATVSLTPPFFSPLKQQVPLP